MAEGQKATTIATVRNLRLSSSRSRTFSPDNRKQLKEAQTISDIICINWCDRQLCFDSISDGKWFLRGQDKIVVRYDPKKSDEEIITVLRFEPYFDRTFLEVRYQDGNREKWMK